MELLIVLFRTVFFYLFIVFIFRIMGKREIAQLSVQDLVVSILIAELVAISIENSGDSMLLTVIPISVLVIFEMLLAFISLHFPVLKDFIEGKPSVIINKGKLNFKEMIKQRYTLDDLLLELRTKNIRSINDVEYAVLENNGKLSIFKYNFLKLDSSFPFPLILDGKVQNDTLKYMHKDIRYIEEILIKNNVSLNQVFYAFVKGNTPFVIKKSDLVNK
ncbi:MAG: DUF421 domain-containing protein [Bacilli bacterium]